MTSTFNWRPLKTEVGSLIELEWSIGSVGLNESFRKSTNCPLGTLSIYFQSKMYVNIYWKRLPQTKHPNSLFSRQVEVSISHRVRFIERLALQAFMTFMATYTYRLNCEKLPIQSGRTQSTSRRVKDLSKMFQWSIYLRQISLVSNTEHSKATMLNAKFALFTFEWSQRPIAGDCGHLPQFHK